MASFLHSIADKAQTALNATPIGPHVSQLTSQFTSSGQHGAQQQQGAGTNDQSAQGNKPAATSGPQSGRSYAFENVQHQFRVLQQQYGGNSSALQRLITAQKGVAIDFDGASRDIKAQSKELFMWGQTEHDDLKDVSDRLAYLNFVQGTLSATVSTKLNSSRVSLKSVRDAEAALQPKRNIRTGIQLQINRIKNDGQKGGAVDQKIADLESQLRRLEVEDQDAENQFEILKRKSLKESEEAKWAAMREYGEKLVLLSQASSSFLNELPSVPPTANTPYKGAASTARTRAALQHTLDSWVTGHMKAPSFESSGDSLGDETRSFGETHASELSGITSSGSPSVPSSGALNSSPQPQGSIPTQPSAHTPMNTSQLNTSLANIPSQTSGNVGPGAAQPLRAPGMEPTSSASSIPAPSPTVAETGLPIAAGSAGPGPRSGSLSQGRPTTYMSADDEKKRLEREERERILHQDTPPSSYHPPSSQGSGPGQSTTSQHESAGDEKKRLEREERDRILREGGSNQRYQGNNPPGRDDNDQAGVPPPYKAT